MKQIIIVFISCFVLFSCNNDDDQPDPIVEEELDLSFPECLLSNDIFEYMLIMENEPTEPRGHINKSKYEGVEYYTFNVFSVTDVNVPFYTNDCEAYCTFFVLGGTNECTEDFWYNGEQIGVVWTDPR